jgi:hypothetical protein
MESSQDRSGEIAMNPHRANVKGCPIADGNLSNVRRCTITHLFKVVLRACPKTSNGKGAPSAIGTSEQIQLVYYLASEIIGALLGSLFVKYIS